MTMRLEVAEFPVTKINLGNTFRYDCGILEIETADRIVGPYEEIQILNDPGAPVVPARESLKLDALDMIAGGADIWGLQTGTCRGY